MKDLSVYAKFRLSTEQFSRSSDLDTHVSPDTLKLLSTSPSYILAWTTTPWTLPSNRALVVDAKEDYVVVEHESAQHILAQKRFDAVFEGKEAVVSMNKIV